MMIIDPNRIFFVFIFTNKALSGIHYYFPLCAQSPPEEQWLLTVQCTQLTCICWEVWWMIYF